MPGKGRKQFCEHYNGLSNSETCEAGVRYVDVASREHEGKTYADMKRLPCFTANTGPDVAHCDKCRHPTAEEIAARDAEMKARWERISKVRSAIVESLGGPWKRGMMGVAGSITCPCCGGTVQFSRAGYNGHIHAACSTPDCASWME